MRKLLLILFIIIGFLCYESSSQSLFWQSTVTDPTGEGVAVDSSGNIYVVGSTSRSIDSQTFVGGTKDVYVMKYSSSGSRLWTRMAGSTSTDDGAGIAVDTVNSFVYITGYAGGTVNSRTFAGGSKDILLMKYDLSGNLQWTRLMGTTGDDEGFSVAVDGSRNFVYVSGYLSKSFGVQTSIGGEDFMMMKFDDTGSTLWTRMKGSTSNDRGYAVDLDLTNGFLYSVGYVAGSEDSQSYSGGFDIIIFKYLINGDRSWTRMVGGTNNDMAYGVVYDSSSGNLYLTGSTMNSLDSQSTSGGQDIVIMKYDSSGNRLWTRIVGSGADDVGLAIAVDSLGFVYVGGYAVGINVGAYVPLK